MKISAFFGIPSEEGGERHKGSLLFADPSRASFTECINDSIGLNGTNSGPKTTPRIKSMTGNLTPWDDRTGYRAQDSWAEMNSKRGTKATSEKD